MKHRLIIFIVGLSLSLSLPAMASEITDDSFNGQWCGKWDGIYALCLTIDSIAPGAKANYRWVERQGDGFKKSLKKIERLNLNSLNLENIIFVLQQRNQEKAHAIGIFREQTRMAELTRTSVVDEQPLK